jgi:signal peptidase II
MPERSYRALLWALALTGVLADQATKYGMFAWLQRVEGHRYSLFSAGGPREDPKGFHLRAEFESCPGRNPAPHVNQGALFGLGQRLGADANTAFAAVSLLAALAIVYWAAQKGTAADRWLCAALGLILAGTLGNLYDRVVFHGVRDLLHWTYLFNWPVFNVADCCLVCGASLLLLQAFAGSSQPAKDRAAPGALGASAAVSGVPCGAGVPAGPKG